ncbi:uncharacterized protein LOC103944459 [Pyrus x bretschneideri]|uniref:uncharacterized protein LOC103944459 n=1 Tax=Pyrus x bretschneideri TaxID=225117 RepID=UPI0020301A3C|nr:uncharacterized protein LOC103944459 [Pyrus x bretschneideri]
MAMQMAQYQARIEIEDAKLFNAKVELINSFMQSEHHGESSHRSSVTGRSYVQRDKEECHDQMMKNYFIECLRFPAHDFRRRFRMKSTAIENRKRFCKAIEGIYRATYLRNPNREDLKRLLRKADKRGFPGIIGSLDCMHWEWKNVLLLGLANSKAVMTSQPSHSRLWRFTTHGFGMLYSGLLDQTTISTFFGLLLCSIMLSMDGHQNFDTSAKKKLFSQRQESYRKDVEKAFGILQAQWTIIRGPAQFWQSKDLHSIMMTYIILHNMIVEDKYIEIEEDSDEDVDDDQPTHARAIARDVEYLAPTT